MDFLSWTQIETHPVYLALLVYFGLYPIVSSVTWITTSLMYYVRRERKHHEPLEPLEPDPPLVSILIPAYCEEAVIQRTLEGVLDIEYPNKEIVVVDDGSTDSTVEKVMPFVDRGEVRLVRKVSNEGKAMALNDAIPCLSGELVLIMDADAYPDPSLLKFLVPHFRSARVGAVTGNPKVANRETFLAKLQIIEFTSIVSVLRRAQRVWGRILTMSGVVGIFRKSAMIHAGLYSPEMATEDIDISWKLQRRFWDVRYESKAIVWMQAPSRLAGLWRQRIRWAKGLAQILRRHGSVLRQSKTRRLWPVYIESVLSITWAYCAILLISFWGVSRIFGHIPFGISPIPAWWGMLIATLCVTQLLTGVLMERSYDREVVHHFPVAVFYPVIYWMLMALVTTIATPMGLFGRMTPGAPTRWRSSRESLP